MTMSCEGLQKITVAEKRKLSTESRRQFMRQCGQTRSIVVRQAKKNLLFSEYFSHRKCIFNGILIFLVSALEQLNVWLRSLSLDK